VDRALEAFNEVLRLDPENQYALMNIEKLHENQHQWQEAYEVRRTLESQAGGDEGLRSQAILAFLENELGLQALVRGEYAAASGRFKAAIDLDPTVVPAYLNLGDSYARDDQPSQAIATWERLVEKVPERAYLAFDRLALLYSKLGMTERFAQLCRTLIAGNPQDWRARHALARTLETAGQSSAALELLFEALVYNPHALSLHQSIWQVLSRMDYDRTLVQRYVELTRHAVFYVDPHVCMRCRYRSTELLWQCPHCHEWNTFVEERIAPAKEHEEMGV
jgi:lipopolysaccharide biosynthesis regulator YciM